MNKASKDLIDILSKNSPLAGRLADYEIVQLIGVSTVRAYGEKATILKGGGTCDFPDVSHQWTSEYSS